MPQIVNETVLNIDSERALHFYWGLINAGGGRKRERVYLCESKFRDELLSTLSRRASRDSRELAIALRYFYTYADLEICRRSRFAMQSPDVVEGYCLLANSYLIKESSRPTNLLVSHKDDFEFTLKTY